jgi:hypothetical protein
MTPFWIFRGSGKTRVSLIRHNFCFPISLRLVRSLALPDRFRHHRCKETKSHKVGSRVSEFFP